MMAMDAVFQTFLRVAGGINVVMDIDGTVMHANDAALEVLGSMPPDARNFFSLLDEQTRLQVQHNAQNNITTPIDFAIKHEEQYYQGKISLSPPESGHVPVLLLHGNDVSEKRAMEEDLRREKQRHLYLLEALPGFVFIINETAHVSFANRTFRRLFGHPKSLDCHIAADVTQTPCSIDSPYEAMRRKRPVQREWTDSKDRVYHVHCHPMTDLDGSLLALVMGIDITARKRAEDALRQAHDELEMRIRERTRELLESESRYRAIVEDQTELICRFTPKLMISFVNNAFCRFFDVEKEEVLGQPFTPPVPEEDKIAAMNLMADVSPEDPVRTEEFRIVTHGETYWMRWSVRAIYDQSGTVIEYQAVGRNITSRKQAERRYHDLVQNLPVIVFSMLPNLGIEFISQSCRTILGYAPSEATQNPDWFLENIHEEDKNRVKQQMDSFVVDRSLPLSLEFRFRHAKGYIVHLLLKSIPRPNASDKSYPEGVEGIIMDMTERFFLDKMLVQREKLNTLGAMSDEIAHEFRNPLTALAGFANRLAKKQPDLPEVGVILEEAGRLESLLNRLRSYLNKPEEAVREACSVNAILRFCVDLLGQTLARQSLACMLELDEGVSSIASDQDTLTQIFLNLIQNAAVTVEPSGQLRIKTFETRRDVSVEFTMEPRIQKTRDSSLLFTPEGDGQADSSLAVSYRLMRNIGGFILQNQNGETAVFTVTLPKEDVRNLGDVS
ncbi:PAS domain S-box protein [Desulfovibrio inopinatus]|uniref:PAS domain S-box protein n=1 Tax=Desulfovibrio inopinatus TaxID=102109 RepID=UPI00146FA6D2|nr:PAS domain S-box protein [Desulfovibrio inopinatus]